MAHGGDKAAREKLIVENMGLIWSIVKRFAGRGYEQEDLFQIGSIGLIKAIDKFDGKVAEPHLRYYKTQDPVRSAFYLHKSTKD